MIRFTRQNSIWMAALSLMMALVIVSNSVTAEAQAVLLAVFMMAMAASVIDLSRRPHLVETIQQRSARSRMSGQAREAVDRARNRPGYRDMGLQLLDVGMIAAQSGQEGLVMRRTRTISKDDDGVRPFVTLLVPSHQSEHSVQVRFEVIDQNGRDQYIHEMDVFLRDGEMNILPENHLPLLNNEHVAGMGDWDLRVYVNNSLVGIHNFALTASIEERRRRVSSGGQYYVMGDEERRPARESQPAPPTREDMPLSLEDLLRNQTRENRS